MLTVQLKRFSFHRMFGDKINKHIQFPLEFDLAPFMSDHTASSSRVMYDLLGVVVHAGHDPQSGHYYSFVKAERGQWFVFDDSAVRPVAASSVLSARAYMLLYQRRSPKAPASPAAPPAVTPAGKPASTATAAAATAAPTATAATPATVPAAAAGATATAAASTATAAPGVVPRVAAGGSAPLAFGSVSKAQSAGADPLGVLPQELVRSLDMLGVMQWTPAVTHATPALAVTASATALAVTASAVDGKSDSSDEELFTPRKFKWCVCWRGAAHGGRGVCVCMYACVCVLYVCERVGEF